MKIGIAGNGKIVYEMIGATKNIQDLEIVAICSRPQSRQKAEEIYIHCLLWECQLISL